MFGKKIKKNKMLRIKKIKQNNNKKNKIRSKMIKILTVFPGNGAKFDNAVVDTIKLILLIYNNCSIIKKVPTKYKG